ncbi:MAG: hypothetical protein WAQ27_03040 [Candidatus Microsaccharimonas sp.]
MLLFSIAMGVGCVGVLILAVVVCLMIFEAGLNGDPIRVFGHFGRFGSGPRWGMIFLAVAAVLYTAAGVTGFIVLGYQPIDFFVTVIAAIVAFVIALIGRGLLVKIES